MNETQLLRDAGITPTMDVLENITEKEIFSIYKKLYETITGSEFELNPEWKYYNDGKAWLCKVSYRKKTVFWLSVWNTGIKTSFYFTEKTRQGVLELTISNEIKERFTKAASIGKLIPLSMSILNDADLADLRKIIHYKKALK
jgi:hypothetical protein